MWFVVGQNGFVGHNGLRNQRLGVHSGSRLGHHGIETVNGIGSVVHSANGAIGLNQRVLTCKRERERAERTSKEGSFWDVFIFKLYPLQHRRHVFHAEISHHP